LRNRQEMNQEKLAKLSGVSKSRLSRIINERSMPSMAELQKIADALRVKTAFFVSDSDEIPPFQFTEKDLVLLKDPDLTISLRGCVKSISHGFSRMKHRFGGTRRERKKSETLFLKAT